MTRNKLAGLLAIVAAATVLGMGAVSTAAPSRTTHPGVVAADSTETTNGSGEGPNR